MAGTQQYFNILHLVLFPHSCFSDPKLARVQDGSGGFIYFLEEENIKASKLSLFKYETKMAV